MKLKELPNLESLLDSDITPQTYLKIEQLIKKDAFMFFSSAEPLEDSTVKYLFEEIGKRNTISVNSIPLKDKDYYTMNRIYTTLKMHNYVRIRKRINGKLARVWVPSELSTE